MLQIREIYKTIEQEIEELRNLEHPIKKTQRLKFNILEEHLKTNLIDLTEYITIEEYLRVMQPLKPIDKTESKQTTLIE